MAGKCFSRQHTSARSRTSDGDCKDIPVRKRQPSSRPSHRPYRLPRITILTLTVPYSCQAFGVPWSPVHSRLFIDCHHDHVSLQLPVSAYHGAYRPYAVPARLSGVSLFSFPINHDPTILLSIPHFRDFPLCLTLNLLPHRPTSN